MRRRDLLAAGIAVGSAALAGCTATEDGDASATPSATPAETTTTERTPTATPTPVRTVTGAAEPVVTASGESFSPRRIRVPPGTTVRWENTGSGTHSVQSAVFNPDVATEWSYYSADLVSGNATSHAFPAPGVYEYYCTVHGRDTMCGVVLVGDVRYGGTLPCEA